MTIKYRSTRGKQNGLSFEEVVLGGLASDKGLFVPETIPTLTLDEIEKMRSMSYDEMAFAVISKYVSPDDIPHEDLKRMLEKSFASFRSKDVTPLVRLKDFWVMELFHGPTFAFKDVALQFLGNLFEFFLTRGRIQNSLTILGATSGDTGSAAIHGLRGKKNVDCFIMFPEGKVTEIQERQMTTIPDKNVHCIAIEGDFDDAQAIVKAAFADEKFRDEVKLGAINSINWARVLAQITYYFFAWLQVTNENKDNSPVNFAVPTGNFGDILAGYYAKRMGLPVDKLIICTNQNDVLHRFFNTGIYQKVQAVLTIAPSMDISVSSNFERYLFYLSGEAPETLASWMNIFEKTGEVTLPMEMLNAARKDFLSAKSDKDGIISTMRTTFCRENYLVCPHTATAVDGILKLKLPAERTVCLATAHPAKFEEAVNLALSAEVELPERPKELQDLFDLKTRRILFPKSLETIENYIKSKKSNSRMWMTLPLILTSVAVITIGLYAYVRVKK